MNETALEQAAPRSAQSSRWFGTRETRQSSAFYGYSLTIIALGIGWQLKSRELISPADGLGYWLGIIGGSMMLTLLLYPLRKRIRILSFLGQTTHFGLIHFHKTAHPKPTFWQNHEPFSSL